jgi:hypothetical protein
MGFWHSIAHFSAFMNPSGDALMGALKGYFDESGKEDDPQFADSAVSVAGYVTTVDSWRDIEARWKAVLDRPEFGVPYLHMKEFAHFKPGSPFESWKGDEPRREALIAALALVVRQSDLTGAGAIVRVPDLVRFNSDNGLQIQAYPFGVYATLVELSRRYPNESIETIWDKVERHHTKLALARDYADSDISSPGCGAQIEMFPLEKCRSSKDIPALQIADFIAYELLKAHRDRNDWFLTEEPKIEPVMWGASQADWLQAQGREWPGNRKSYMAWQGGPTSPRPMDGHTWTYKSLTHRHRQRQGIWSVPV